MLRERQCALVWVEAIKPSPSHGLSAATAQKSRPSLIQASKRCRRKGARGLPQRSDRRIPTSPGLATCPGRHRKGQGSFRQALPLHCEIPRTISLAPCRLLRRSRNALVRRLVSSKARTPSASISQALAALMHELKLVPRIVAHVKNGLRDRTALQTPFAASLSQLLRVTQTWPCCLFCNTGTDGSCLSLATQPAMAGQKAGHCRAESTAGKQTGTP